MEHILFQPALYDIPIQDAITLFNDYNSGYKHTVMDIPLQVEFLDDFIKFVNKVSGEMKEYDYTKSKNDVYRIFENDILKLYIGGNSSELFCTICGVSEELVHSVWSILNQDCGEEDLEDEMYAHTYFLDGNDLDSNVKRIEHKDLKYLSPKYYPYIDLDVMFDQFFTCQENILLIVGTPGLGKSKLSSLALRYAFENIDKIPYDKMENNPTLDNQFVSVAFVKSVDVLAHDKFWREIDKKNHDFVVIDDLDFMLTKRDSEISTSEDIVKNTFLNQFLSYTDGVEKHKTKFIITTNQKYDDIDAALLRKGRLFDILELRKLKKAEAKEIWKEAKLLDKDFEACYKSVDEILPADLGSEISKRQNKRIKNNLKPYALEEGISKVKMASRSKKIGM